MTFVTVYDQLPADKATPEYLGGKGYGLWWMQQLGVNVPPALILPTTACTLYMQDPKAAMQLVVDQLPDIRKFFNEKFGYMPLLSVRSGARVSMPGMMDTILNVGLDSKTFHEWESRLGVDCVFDSYNRLVSMYGSVVKQVDHQEFDGQSLPKRLEVYKRKTGEDFPEVDQQILGAVEAVFRSWNNERAQVYRKIHDIPDTWGTAVVIQAMVFGNLNDKSGTGVLFTRNVDTGENEVVGEFLQNAQGEDVVAGTRTPMPLSKLTEWNSQVSSELLKVAERLESERRDVQDIEFTIQDGQLYVLQTRSAKRSAKAAVKIALDLLNSGVIDLQTAKARVSARDLDLADQPVLDPKFNQPPLATGIPACSGVVTGKIATTVAQAQEYQAQGVACVLVRQETTPDDIKGMLAAKGVLTITGGTTSHAAVVARGFNKPCVVGLSLPNWKLVLKAGKTLSFCGATGRVWLSEVPVIAGAHEAAEAFRNIVLGQGALLTSKIPDWSPKRMVLDLRPHLLLPNEQIKDMVVKASEKTQDLGVLLCVPEDDPQGHLQVLCGSKHLESRVSEIEKLLDTLEVKLTAYGWTTSKHPAIDCTATVTLEQLVMAQESMLVLKTTKLSPAMEKVLSWKLMEDPLFVFKGLNTKGSPAAWTVHVHG